MKWERRSALSNWLLRCVAGSALLLGGCRPSVPGGEGGVVVLVLDGVRVQESLGEEISQATETLPREILPHTWSELVPRGVRGMETYNVGVTITASAHAALLAGRRLPQGNYDVSGEVGTYRPELPSLLEAIRDELDVSEEEVWLVGNTALIAPLSHSLYPSSTSTGLPGASFSEVWPIDDDGLVFDEVRRILEAHRPRFVLANLHRADRLAHYSNDPDAYPDAVAALDDELVEFWEWLGEREGELGSFDLVVVADHGRHVDAQGDPVWRNHGDACMGCRHVPLLALGPSFRNGVSEEVITLEDIAPTVALALGVEMPWAAGRAVKDLFVDAPLAAARRGVAEVSASGGAVARVVYLDEPYRRKAVEFAGRELSSPEAIDAESVTLAGGEEGGLWLCFRELFLESERSVWIPRCMNSVDGGATWEELAGPEESVGPFWSVALIPQKESVLAVYPRNLRGTVTPGNPGDGADACPRVCSLDPGQAQGARRSLW